MVKKLRAAINREKQAQKHRELARFYNPNSMLGNDWAIFYFLIGGRMTGKSYSLTDYLCNRKEKLGDKCKNYWFRISDTSVRSLLCNKADKLVDPDLVRKYHLELSTKGYQVFDHGKVFMEVYPLTGAGKAKGLAAFDKDYDGEYNIVLDEFIYDAKSEKKPSIDILYSFVSLVETMVRTTKSRIKVFFAANSCADASGILASAFNFIPEKFGRYYLKSKRCIVDNIEPTEEYIKDRTGSIADILTGGNDSNFTNELKRDLTLLYKGRLVTPLHIIKFDKDNSAWFTMWSSENQGVVIKRWNKESIPKEKDFAMRPYLDTYFNKEKRQAIYDLYDSRVLLFRDLTTQARFKEQMSYIRKN